MENPWKSTIYSDFPWFSHGKASIEWDFPAHPSPRLPTDRLSWSWWLIHCLCSESNGSLGLGVVQKSSQKWLCCRRDTPKYPKLRKKKCENKEKRSMWTLWTFGSKRTAFSDNPIGSWLLDLKKTPSMLFEAYLQKTGNNKQNKPCGSKP